MLKLMLDKGVDYLAAILLAAMTILVFMQVIFRYWLHLPLDWGEEVSRYLFIWAAMLGAAIAMRRQAHFGIDSLVAVLPPIMRMGIALIVNLCICALTSLVAVQGTRLAIINLLQISPTLAIPMALPYAAIPVSALLMLICAICDTWGIVSGALREKER
jgi:TRAP-type C4-dicarboxylate transport system permease small subunit